MLRNWYRGLDEWLPSLYRNWNTFPRWCTSVYFVSQLRFFGRCIKISDRGPKMGVVLGSWAIPCSNNLNPHLLMWAKQCHVYHPQKNTIFIGGINLPFPVFICGLWKNLVLPTVRPSLCHQYPIHNLTHIPEWFLPFNAIQHPLASTPKASPPGLVSGSAPFPARVLPGPAETSWRPSYRRRWPRFPPLPCNGNRLVVGLEGKKGKRVVKKKHMIMVISCYIMVVR